MNPEIARTTQLGLNRGKRKELLKAIDDRVVLAVETGEVRDRESLVKFLESEGLRVTKQSKEFVTVVNKSDTKMRLKGDIYANSFERSGWIKKLLSAKEESAANREGQSISELKAAVDKAVQTRIAYNEKRHPSPQQKATSSNQIEASKLRIDSDFLPDFVPDDLPSDMANNQAPTSPGHTSAPGLPSHPNSHHNDAKMQPKRLATRQPEPHLTQAEMTAEAILRLIEKLANLFGINANIGSFKNDGNRTKFNELAQSTRATNARVSNTLRAVKQRRNNQDANAIESSRSIEQIERETNESNRVAKQAIADFGAVVKKIGYAIKEKLEQQQQEQQQNNNNNMEWK